MKKESKILSVKLFAFFVSIIYLLSFQANSKNAVYFLKKGTIMPLHKNYYIVHTPIVAILNNNKTITIPSGFKTDLASVPRAFWSIFPPDRATYMYPAILHDYLYESDALKSRKKADLAFFDALRNQGASKKSAYTMYIVVRLFGFLHYRKVKKK
jgi:hypothetical protein